MESTELTEDFESGLFQHTDGRRFVRCEFDPDNPVWIDVSSNVWTAVYSGSLRQIDWDSIALPLPLVRDLQSIAQLRLKNSSPGYLTQLQAALRNFVASSDEHDIELENGFSDLDSPSLLLIWESMDSHSRSLFRSLYRECADKGIAGAKYALAREIKSWKARSEIVQLREVVHWNPEKGAFTAAEWEVVRGFLEEWDLDEHPHVIATKIFGRILTETLKRPSQIWSMPKDALWVIQSSNGTGPDEFFLRIPKAKAQKGERPGTWQITEALGKAIQEYSQIPEIQALQDQVNRLAVLPGLRGRPRWLPHGEVDAQSGKACLKNLIKQAGLISPRTGDVIHLTPYRIRHTGGTAMALQGIPREQIQEILEHDSPFTADAYIQAVGSDLMPALERATDRGVGEVFSILTEAYFFKGTVTDDIGKKAITIPAINIHEPSANGLQAPAVVGGCGKDGACSKHPFWACYNGCPHFLAWKEADHQKSLDYVDSELARWSKAEGGRERTKLHKDFDRVAASIREVVQQVEAANEDVAE
jgi:integrase